MTHAEPSIGELREESARTRAALAHSVNELRSKIGGTAGEVKSLVSPEHIKGEVRSYVRDTGASLYETMSARARENPLQALAAGAAIAVPLLKIVRSVPLPLLLIGGGYWLSTKSGREALSVANEKIGETVEAARSQTSGMMASAGQTAADLKDSAMAGVADASSSVASTVQPFTDKARATAHDLRDAASGMMRSAQGSAASAMDGGSASSGMHGMSGMSDGMSARARDVAHGITRASERSQQSIADFVHNNPLLTAAIGLAAGAVLASAFPVTSTERKVLGPAGARLKSAGRDAASQGLDRASEAIDEAVNAAAAAAEREGLSPEGIANAMREAAEKAKAVADKAIQRATNGRALVNGEPL